MQPKDLGFIPGIVTKLKIYLEKDNVYYPMYKIDSIFTYQEKLSEHAEHYITESLKQLLKKLFKINFADVLVKAGKLTINEVNLNNNKSLAIEIVNATKYK